MELKQNEEKNQMPAASPANSKTKKFGGKKQRIILIILIIFGLILAASPFIGRLYNYWQEKQLLASFADEDNETEIKDPGQTLIDLSLLEEDEVLPEEEGLRPVPPSYKPTIIGSIKIPKLKLLRPIANDVSRGDLRVAVGKMPGSSNIGQEGNITLVGHRNYAYKVFFNDLDKLVPGDLIILESNTGTFTYEIFQSKIIEPDDNSVLAIKKNQYLITLITCHPKFKNDKRLVYIGQLIDPLPQKTPEIIEENPKPPAPPEGGEEDLPAESEEKPQPKGKTVPDDGSWAF